MPHTRHSQSRGRGRRATGWLSALIAIAAGAAGCKFEPKFTSGSIPCQSSKNCPPGFVCVAAYCYAAGVQPDGADGTGGAGEGDGMAPPTRPSPIGWKIEGKIEGEIEGTTARSIGRPTPAATAAR